MLLLRNTSPCFKAEYPALRSFEVGKYQLRKRVPRIVHPHGLFPRRFLNARSWRFLYHGKVRPMIQKHSAMIAVRCGPVRNQCLRRKRIMPLMRSAANGESCRSGYFYGKILTEYTGKVLKLIVKDGFFIRNLVHEFA